MHIRSISSCSVLRFKTLLDIIFPACCCLLSETYGRNEVTQIFRSFHRTVSSTTIGWSRWDILMCCFKFILSTTVSFLDLTDAIFFLQGLLFFIFVCVHFHKNFASRLCMCVMYLTDSFDDRGSQCHLI